MVKLNLPERTPKPVITGFGVRSGKFSFTMTLQTSSSPVRDKDDPLSFGNMSFMWAI